MTVYYFYLNLLELLGWFGFVHLSSRLAQKNFFFTFYHNCMSPLPQFL